MIDNEYENRIYELETQMWKAAAAGDADGFLQLVSENAVMLCGGYRCTGAEYAELIKDFSLSDFSILHYETVFQTEDIMQVTYVVRTMAYKPENADLAGMFRVTSTWRMCNGEYKLIFNMDSRLEDRGE